MAHGSGGGVDFHLPDEILSVIPTDPYDQLDLARRITGMAIASRVSKLESEAGRMRQKIADKDRVIADLQDRLAQLDRAVQDSDARLRAALEDNVKLSKEREMLTMTTKKLGRDLTKLETFKRHLMKSLNDDNLSQQEEAVNIGGCDQSIVRSSSWKDEMSISRTVSDTVSGSTDTGDSSQDERLAGIKFSGTPYITPRITPISTPKGSSTGATPRAFSTAGSSPKYLSGTTSPTNTRFEGHTSFSPWYPSTQQPSAPSSPPQGSSLTGRTRIDGKEFFCQARNRLSYEQFGAFLASIKELNAKRQSREETLEKAEEIFGTENKDLFLSFQGMLNRNLP